MIEEFPLIEVSGTPYQLGYQHGSQAKGLVQKYLTWIEKLTGQSRDILVQRAITFLPLIKQLSNDLASEIQGLADGADISLEEAVLCQVRTEASQTEDGGCTTFAFTGQNTTDGLTLIGQNQDLEPQYEDVAILLHLKPIGKPRALIFTFAGQLGYAGLNQHGVAHFTNALYGYQWQYGTPHYPIKRILLEQDNLAKCLELLQSVKVCSATNKVICDGEGQICDIEIYPSGYSIWQDKWTNGLVHTNHALTDDYVPQERYLLPDSRSRLNRARQLFEENLGCLSVSVIKEILSDHDGHPAGICRHGADGMYSVSGYIAEAEKRLLHIRRGPGCLGQWKTYAV